MGKFDKDAKDLLDAIGGPENIAAVSHCATRMRFVLNDPDKPNEKVIEDIPAVKGMFTNAGQFQVIIGNEVPDFYNDFSAVSGVKGVSKDAAKTVAKKNQNPLQRAVTVLAEIFTPLLPAIIVGGLILGFRNVLGDVSMGFLGGKTIVETSPFWAGVNEFLWLPGEAIFHFLPVGITWSIAKKMGTTEILGIVLGITLVSPQLLNAYAVNGTSAAEIAKNWVWNFGSFTIDKIGYQAQVIPAMLAGFLLVYLEKFFRKRIPEAVSMIFVPLFSLLPTIIAAHVILGPIGWKVGEGISHVVNAGLTSSVNWLFGAIFGAVYAPLVITGLHHTTLAIDSQLIATYGSTNLWPMICLSNIAQGGAVLAVIYLHRGNKKEEAVSIPSLISAWLGVTEPAMFGINLKYVFPFIAAMVGSGIAGLIVTLFGVRANSIGVGGLPGILAIQAKYWPIFIVAMLIAIAVPLVATIIMSKMPRFNQVEEYAETLPITPEDEKAAETAKTVQAVQNVRAAEEIASPLKGQALPLAQAKDPVFAEGMMGQGVVIEPSEGRVVAPFDGSVALLFPTKHAIGLVSDQGVELMIHIGIDTVKLDGQHFTAHVKQGDRIKRGDLLVEFDKDAIKAAGYETQTPVIVTNGADFQVDALVGTSNVTPGEKIISAVPL